MSHFTKVQTQLTEVDVLERALVAALHWPVNHHGLVRGYMDNSIRADLVAVNPDTNYDIGFAREGKEGNFELVADFYGLPELKAEQVIADISKRYALDILEQECQEMGYAVTQLLYEQDGSIRVVMEQW